MAQQVKHSFGSGELSDELLGRTDLEKYDLAARRMENVVCNYGGGAFKRRGLRFVEFLQHPEYPIRFFTFKFSDEVDDTYLVIFGQGYIRFVQDFGYVLEAVKVSSSSGDTVTSTAHGFLAGDMIYFTGEAAAYLVVAPTANTFKVSNMFGDAVDPPAAATSVARVYTLLNPYSSADFATIQQYQVFDQMKFTHVDYPPYILSREVSTWALVVEARDAGVPLAQTPTIATSRRFISYVRVVDKGAGGYNRASNIVVSDATGTGFKGILVISDGDVAGVEVIEAGEGYSDSPTAVATGDGSGAAFEVIPSKNESGLIIAVSANLSDGTETGITRPAITRASPNYSLEKGWLRVEWAAVPDAVSYNVYRSVITPNGDDIHLGFDLGYIGTVQGTSFTDNNIAPDFTRTPKLYRDPFAGGAVVSIRVLTPGAGYSSLTTCTLSGGGGSGFVGYPIVRDGGVIGIYVAHPGSGYSSPVLTVGSGSGATFDIELSPLEGNHPAVSFVYQERAGYAGTSNEPMTVFASRLRDFKNFATSRNITAADPYEHTIDAREITPIRHVLPVKAGLMLFTSKNVGLLRGSDGAAPSATVAILDQQSFIGASAVAPALIADDIIYIQHQNRAVRMLSFEANARSYQGREISILARHLFGEGQPVTAMAFTYAIDKTGFGIYADGSAFSLTFDKDQDIYGFTRISTAGMLHDVVSISVENEEHIYFQVERTHDGRPSKAIEVMLPEATSEIEDAVYLDGCLSIAKLYRDVELTSTGYTGDVTVTASDNIFTIDMIDYVIGLAGGRGYITNVLSPLIAEVTLTRDCCEFAHQFTTEVRAKAGTWWMNPLVSSVSGVPYEGLEVEIVGDGRQLEPQTVVDGTVTLDTPSAIVHVGLKYRARIVTLPVVGSPQEQLDGKSITVVSANIKVRRSGAFTVGDGVNQYESGFRSDENWGEATRLRQTPRSVFVSSGWDDEGELTMENDNGLPWEILQVVMFYNASD